MKGHAINSRTRRHTLILCRDVVKQIVDEPKITIIATRIILDIQNLQILTRFHRNTPQAHLSV